MNRYKLCPRYPILGKVGGVRGGLIGGEDYYMRAVTRYKREENTMEIQCIPFLSTESFNGCGRERPEGHRRGMHISSCNTY